MYIVYLYLVKNPCLHTMSTQFSPYNSHNTLVHNISSYSVSSQPNNLIGCSSVRDNRAKIVLANCLLHNENIMRNTLEHLIPYTSNYCECFSQYSKTIPIAAIHGQCKGLPL